MTQLWKNLIANAPDLRELAAQRLDNAVNYARQTGYVSPAQLEKIAVYTETVKNDPGIMENFCRLFAIYSQGAPEEVLGEPFPEELAAGIGEKQLLLIVALALIPTAEERFTRAGLPLSQLYCTFDEIGCWIANCERNYGITGLEFWHGFAWLTMRLFNFKVLRFGRLEYNRCDFFADVMVFRHRKSGKMVVAAVEEYKVNGSGLTAAPGEEVQFTTAFRELPDGSFIAHEIRADGIIEKVPLTITPGEYEIFLKSGDPVLYMHIPELGPLKTEEVLKSYQEVKAFYKKVYPDYPVKAIVSHSWLFDPVLRQLLPENSNLCRYQRTGHLLPQTGPSDAVRRVLGQPAVDNGVESVEWKSSLQKALGTYIVNGGYCRGGGIIIF